MNIRSQHDLTHTFRAQLREAGRMNNPKRAETKDEAGGDGGSDEGSPPSIALSDAVIRNWSSQVASRRLLSRALLVPEHFGDHDEEWDGSLKAPILQQPPGLNLRPKGEAFLKDYATKLCNSHARHEGESMPGAALVIDLDEAVHGGYALVKDVYSVIKGGMTSLEQEYGEIAQKWIEAPLEAIGHAVAPTSAVALGLNIGVGAPLGGLAWKAAREGYQAIGECRANGDRLKLRHKEAQQNAGDLDTAMTYFNTMTDKGALGPVSDAVARKLLHTAHKEDELRLARKHNRLSRHIGGASLLSGASILGKVGIAAPMSAGFSIASAASGLGVTGSSALIAQSTAAATAATVGGIAATALSLPAAVGAIGLGALFTHKSIAQQREFRVHSLPARVHLHRTLAGMPLREERDKPTARIADYCHFVLAKAKSRAKFYRHFKRMNIGFLGGSTMYGASAVGTGAAIAVAAAAGLSNPVGWGVLTGLGTLGGMIMAGNSLQFLRGHHRQQRYDAYVERDDPLLDRDFLSTVDLMTSGPAGPCLNQRGIELRARFYDMLGRRDNLRQDFLRTAAADLGHYYAGQLYRSDDAATRAEKQAMVPTLFKRLSALVLKCGGRFLPWRRGGFDLRTAMFDANTKGRRTYTAMSKDSLLDWLSDPANYGQQVEFMSRALGEQSAYLRQKIAVRRDILESIVPQARELALQAQEGQPPPPIAKAGEAELDSLAAVTRFLGLQDQGMERDSLILAELMLLERELGQMRHTRDFTRARLMLVKERFMSMYESNPYNPREELVCDEDAVDQKFAGWVHGKGEDGAEQRMRHLRGMLVNTEMQATELRELAAALWREQGILTEETPPPAPRTEPVVAA